MIRAKVFENFSRERERERERRGKIATVPTVCKRCHECQGQQWHFADEAAISFLKLIAYLAALIVKADR